MTSSIRKVTPGIPGAPAFDLTLRNEPERGTYMECVEADTTGLLVAACRIVEIMSSGDDAAARIACEQIRQSVMARNGRSVAAQER